MSVDDNVNVLITMGVPEIKFILVEWFQMFVNFMMV